MESRFLEESIKRAAYYIIIIHFINIKILLYNCLSISHLIKEKGIDALHRKKALKLNNYCSLNYIALKVKLRFLLRQ